MLRCASITESQAADRQIWNTLSDLMAERGWSMDDSLHEMTHVVHDLPGLLQLRPRPPKATPTPWQPPPGVFSEKGKGKFGKGGTKSKGGDKGKGKGKVQWLTDIRTNNRFAMLRNHHITESVSRLLMLNRTMIHSTCNSINWVSTRVLEFAWGPQCTFP